MRLARRFPDVPRAEGMIAFGIASLSAAIVSVWSGLGLMSLPGLALAAVLAPAATVAMLWWVPWLPGLLTPVLIPIGQVGVLFPFEWCLLLFTGLSLVHVLRHRLSASLVTSPLELVNLAFVLWSLFTLLWAFDALHGFLGARRMLVGLLAATLALRLPLLLPRHAHEGGLVFGALAIASVALVRRAASGFSTEQAIFHRSSATDLGWGTANYIATLLLILSPFALAVLTSSRPTVLRWGAAAALLAATSLQTLVASRAAAVLFFLGLLIQIVLGLRARTRWFGIAAFGLTATLALITPYGQALIERFNNLRDLGSMVIRIWYVREGWRRTVEEFPWGMGLNQGIPTADKMGGIDLHHHWLVVSSELGAPGVLLWLAALVLLFRATSKLRRNPREAAFGLALQVSFWLSQLHSLVEPTFQGVQYQFLWYWLMFGTLAYAWRPASASANSP